MSKYVVKSSNFYLTTGTIFVFCAAESSSSEHYFLAIQGVVLAVISLGMFLLARRVEASEARRPDE